MSLLYLDTYSGISGDMFLGALLDVGVSLSDLRRGLDQLGLKGWTLAATRVQQHGVGGTGAQVRVDDAPQPHRHLSDIRALLRSAGLPERVERDALGVFERLGRAEAKVHGVSVEDVHFHEVGAVDSIIDIVGVCLGLHLLGVTSVRCAPLPLGTGFVRTQHGLLPVPAPATLEILAECGAPTVPGRGEGEMVTPTGAALVAHFAAWEPPAQLRPRTVGYGFGSRTLPWPNALRAVLAASEGYDLEVDTVTLLQCNIDDMPAEVVPFVLTRALHLGALDAWTLPLGMKKGRPGTMLNLLARGADVSRFSEFLLRETTTLGVRYTEWHRYKAGRENQQVHTEYGPVGVKLKLIGGVATDAAPEYEDCATLAQAHGVALVDVYRAARRAADRLLGDRREKGS
ncbi:MAG: nickel pincer cofactor biosynthesis protein LarC [Chloroflexota bacterium]|nr:nickel pincer cofactor biosynthesis protein LarC [Chloroflexota bacterium]